jgi:hypothetical protein
MKIPKQHHTHKRKAPMRLKTSKDMEKYQALLMHWFCKESALDYEQLTKEEAEQALQALMTDTVDIGLQHPQWGRKLWRTYQDGWSSTLLALQAHLQFIEELQGHLGNLTR